ncbi:MAG: hypothetical protein AB1724_06690 [Thermodesulfobacteriota bacterium]
MVQKVKGKEHIVAGRDIIINAVNLSKKFNEIYDELLKPSFDNFDQRIADIFPEGLFSATSGNTRLTFSSEKLFTSLTLLGIPINVALHSIARTEYELTRLSRDQKKISTDDIRWAVANSLYHYDSSGYCDRRRQFWGDKYVRIYGRPNQQLIVISQDGGFHELNYKFIHNVIIPHLIESIWGAGKFEHLRKFISQDDKNEMADQILIAVKSLGIYRIHFSSLIKISRELALQPPHPWLVETAFDYESIDYDYKKAKKHCLDMIDNYEKRIIDSCLYSFRETVHHSSSAILAYYGIYMGCGYLAPLHTLHRIIVLIEQDKAIDATCFEQVDIKSDLRNLGISIIEFNRCVKLLREQLSISSSSEDTDIEIAINLAKNLFEYCDNLLMYFFKLHLLQETDMDGLNSIEKITEAAKAAFHIIPGFEFKTDRKQRPWLIHNLETPLFRNIKNRILFVPLYSDTGVITPSFLYGVEKNISNPEISNCILYVSNCEYSSSCYDFKKVLDSKGIIPFFVKIDDLTDAALSEDSIGQIELYLMDNF